MHKISCDTCFDLMPLVKDGIASEDSCHLVKEHLAGCAHCAAAFGKDLETDTTMNDAAVLGKIKKRMMLLWGSIMLAGTLFGLVLSDGMGMFYNILIMPAIGGFGYLLLKKKAYLIPFALFLFSHIWISVREANNKMVTYTSMTELILISTWWPVILAAFSAIGVLIAWLLHYAFRKEE